jgi:hypothetical protein
MESKLDRVGANAFSLKIHHHPKHMRLFLPLTLVLLGGCASSVRQDGQSLDAAQHLFFPARYEYTVGDFVLSLPIGYYETTMRRLAFAQKIIETGSPKPVLEQEKYLVMGGDALAPKRHYLLLDQRHLLIYSEYFELEDGYPAKLEVLRRIGDAGWKDISDQAVPKSAQSPKGMSFSADRSKIAVMNAVGESKTLIWSGGKLQEQN